jgi:hypothetical protein
MRIDIRKLNEELKFISLNYCPEMIQYDFVTPTTGQLIKFNLINGRLYLSTDNYAETFGYTSSKG